MLPEHAEGANQIRYARNHRRGGAGGEGAVGQKRVGGAAGDEPAAKKHRGGSKGKKKGANQRRREANARDR